MAQEVIPDLIGPITAWHAFAVFTDDGFPLRSFHESKWLRGVNEAKHLHITGFGLGNHCVACPSPPVKHDGVHIGSGCGFYGLPSPNSPNDILGPILMARILMWGTVFEHTDGWRSSHAQIDGFGWPYNDTRQQPPTVPYGTAVAAADWYDVKLLPYRYLEGERLDESCHPDR